MEPIINSQLPEFKVQAFQNGSFKTVTNEVGYFLLLSRRLYVCMPYRTGGHR